MLPSSAMEGLNELPARVARLDDRVGECSALRVEMRAGDEETRRELGTLMRVLHEEVLERLTVIGGRPGRRRTKRS